MESLNFGLNALYRSANELFRSNRQARYAAVGGIVGLAKGALIGIGTIVLVRSINHNNLYPLNEAVEAAKYIVNNHPYLVQSSFTLGMGGLCIEVGRRLGKRRDSSEETEKRLKEERVHNARLTSVMAAREDERDHYSMKRATFLDHNSKKDRLHE